MRQSWTTTPCLKPLIRSSLIGARWSERLRRSAGIFHTHPGIKPRPPSLALDSAFPRMNGGHSGLFPITEDSARLATPPRLPDVSTGQKPPPAGTQGPPIRGPFLNSSGVSAGFPLSLRAREHSPRTSTAAVKQAIPTLPVEPTVTPQPSVNVTGVSACRRAGDSLLSSSRIGSDPRAPVDPQSMGAERTTFGDVSPTRNNAPPPVTGRSATRSASATQCPHRAALRASAIPSEGSPSSNFTPTHEYSTANVVLFWRPPYIFSQWTASAFVDNDVLYCCAEQFMMAEKARFFHDNRALELILSTSEPK